MGTVERDRVALVFRGDRTSRDSSALESSRLAPVAKALADVGLAPEPAVYADEMADEVHSQLLGVHGVLVWVDPVTGSEDRTRLDRILREVATAGVWVSAHPDVILKMGTKEVLYRTRQLGWGSDTHLYRTSAELHEAFPPRLATGGARVLKQYRGNGGIGVWKVQLAPGEASASPDGGQASSPRPDTMVTVQSARARDDVIEEMSLGELMDGCQKYFGYAAGEGRLIDQAFQPRITEGLIRCYLVKDEVVGFSRQYAAGRSPAELEAAVGSGAQPPNRVFGLPAAKTMYGPDEVDFQALRDKIERDWVPGMQALVDVDADFLPALWDADFVFGPKSDAGEDSYVLSEINVSAVAPFPEQALAKLAQAVLTALRPTREIAARS